jgi:hypothetical protein
MKTPLTVEQLNEINSVWCDLAKEPFNQLIGKPLNQTLREIALTISRSIERELTNQFWHYLLESEKFKVTADVGEQLRLTASWCIVEEPPLITSPELSEALVNEICQAYDDDEN